MPWAAISSACAFCLQNGQQVGDTWQLQILGGVSGCRRLGRKTRLPETQRRILWSILDHVRAGVEIPSELFSSRAAVITKNDNVVFDSEIVDETQVITVAYLRFLPPWKEGGLMLSFSTATSVSASSSSPSGGSPLGADIRGRSRSLRVNYPTSHQIGTQADQLLNPSMNDLDRNSEDCSDTVSVFNRPTIHSLKAMARGIRRSATGSHARSFGLTFDQ